ncbi:MAG: hypothetical protein HXL96_05540 [[Eubacterium] sulci]|nr:hypothetical protein [[Eubacterium] sulci]
MTSIGFFSGSASSGSTMLAVSTSKLLADMGKRVLHIFTGISSLYSYVEKNNAGSLDDIKSSLVGRSLTEEEIKATAKTVDGIELIASNKSFLMANTFPVDSFEQILNSSRCFDYVVVDAGSDFRTALTISALCYCNKRIVSITQEPNSISNFKELDNDILSSFGDFELVINKYLRDKSLYSKDDIAYLLKKDISCVIPYSQFGSYAQIERKTLIGEKRYRRAVECLIKEYLGKDNGS